MLTIVIPVYNSAATLVTLGERIDGLGDLVDEVIFVDDGSRDDSWHVLTALIASRPTWRALRLGRNAGQHNALLAGIRAATGSVIVTMDDDLQHPPEQITVLLDALTDEVDVVYGVAADEEHGRARSLSSRVVKRTMRQALGVQHAEYISAFRLFRAHLRDAFADANDPYTNIDALLSWATTRIVACPAQLELRQVGTSNYNIRGLIRHMTNMVTGYSAAPLRVVAYLGLALSLLGFGSLAYVLIRFMVGGSAVQVFTFLAALLSLSAGTQMLGIAVLGEYLARVHFRAMRKPAYFVRDDVGR